MHLLRDTRMHIARIEDTLGHASGSSIFRCKIALSWGEFGVGTLQLQHHGSLYPAHCHDTPLIGFSKFFHTQMAPLPLKDDCELCFRLTDVNRIPKPSLPASLKNSAL